MRVLYFRIYETPSTDFAYIRPVSFSSSPNPRRSSSHGRRVLPLAKSEFPRRFERRRSSHLGRQADGLLVVGCIGETFVCHGSAEQSTGNAGSKLVQR